MADGGESPKARRVHSVAEAAPLRDEQDVRRTSSGPPRQQHSSQLGGDAETQVSNPKSGFRKRFGRKHKDKSQSAANVAEATEGDAAAAPAPDDDSRASIGTRDGLVDPVDASQKDRHVFYRIVVLQGEKLIPADNINGRGEPSSDPYVVLNVYGGNLQDKPLVSAKTATLFKTLSPFWGEEHILPIPKTIVADLEARGRGPLLELAVCDSDASYKKDDYLGGYVLDLQCPSNNIPARYPWMAHDNRDTLEWAELNAPAKDKRPSAARTSILQPRRSAVEDPTSTIAMFSSVTMQLQLHDAFPMAHVKKTTAAEKAYKQRNGHIGDLTIKLQRIPDAEVVTPCEEDAWMKSTRLIAITPIDCTNLWPRKEASIKKLSDNGSMHVVCKMRIGKPGQRSLDRKTSVAKVKASGGLTAQFREAHEFYVKGMYRFLTISILDKAGSESGDGLLSRTCVDCSSLGGEGGPFSKTMWTFSGEAQPELSFALTMEDLFAESDGERDDDSDDEFSHSTLQERNPAGRHESTTKKMSIVANFGYPAAIVTVHVKQARNLLAKDKRFGRQASSDPFCYVEIQRKRKRTKTIEKDLNPVWNEKFKFRVHDLFTFVVLKFFDEDIDSKGASRMEFLGQCIFPLHHVRSGVDEWFALRSETGLERARGEVLVSVDIKMRRKKDETRLSWLQYHSMYVVGRRLADQREAEMQALEDIANQDGIAVTRYGNEAKDGAEGGINLATADVTSGASWGLALRISNTIRSLPPFVLIGTKLEQLDAALDPEDDIDGLERAGTSSWNSASKFYRCAKFAVLDPRDFFTWLAINYDPFDYFGLAGYWTALRYAVAVPPADDLGIGGGNKKFKLKMIGTAVNRLRIQVSAIGGAVSMVKKALNWGYGEVITLLLMAIYCWVCLRAELWMIPLIGVGLFSYTWFTQHQSSNEALEKYRSVYIDDDDSSSDEEDAEDEVDVPSEPSKGLRKKIRKYLQLAANVQNNTARLASYLERVVSLFTWKAPMITEAFIAALVLFSIVLCLVPLQYVALAGVMYMWLDKGRERFHLKSAKVIKSTKGRKGGPLPLDILDRLPDTIIMRQLRRLEPRSISRMAALQNRLGAAATDDDDLN
mmetsp:Transcript_16758/g.49278  ORF Transcript_16758/g.49278 Transcript_16758/m.49278 type:complete len:1109 (+) Transcript_16758:133-3459(+)